MAEAPSPRRSSCIARQYVSVDSAALAYTEGQGAVAVDPLLSVSDSDSATLAGAAVRLIGYTAGEDLLAFTDQNGITGSWDSTNGILTLTGTASPATYQAALQSITYTNPSFDPSTSARTAEFTATDGTLTSAPADRPITLTAVNNAPVITIAGTDITSENTQLLISTSHGNGILVTDVDANGNSEEMTLSVAHGIITLASASNLTFQNGTTATGTSLDFTGTLSDITTALNGLTYTPATGYFGSDSLALTVNDIGNTGIGGDQLTATTVPITVTQVVGPVAHDPSITPASTLAGTQSSSGLLISPNPFDAGEAVWFQITRITGGSLFLSDGVTPVANNDFITSAQGNAGLKFTPAPGSIAPGGFNVQASLTGDTTGLGGNLVPAAVSVTAPTAPVNTVPASQSVAQDTTLVFSASNGNAITVSNSDNASQEITLATDHGALTLATTAGITLISGTGAGDTTVTFSGSPANINAALDGLRFVPAAQYFGPATIQVVSEDVESITLGNPLLATDSVAINVTQAAVPPRAPQIVADTGLSTSAGTVVTVTSAELQAVETGASATQLTFTVTQPPTGGTLLLAGQPLGAGSTFTEADIEQARLTFTPTGTRAGDDAFTFVVTDAHGVTLAPAVFQIHA